MTETGGNGGKPSTLLKTLKAAGGTFGRLDNWINLITGLGTVSRDKVQATSFQRRAQLTDETLEGIYHEDPIGARIVEAIPQEAFRQGLAVQSSVELEAEERAEAQTLLQDALSALDAGQKLQESATWGRLFGGGIILMGADDSRQPNKPLEVEAVKELKWLTVLDKRDLHPETVYSDPAKASFGEVETYRLQANVTTTAAARQPSGTIVHESRLLRFGGVLTSRRERQRLNHWDHSVLHRVQDALRAYHSDWASVSNMLTDSSQGVLKIKGFYELLAGGQKDQFQERLEAISLARFVGRIMPIDAEEDFSYQERSFAGLPDLMDRTTLRLSAASGGIPISVLFGRAPAGLSGDAAGASDIVKWNNLIRAQQEQEYAPQANRLIRILAQALDVPEPESWSISWPNLWQMTPEQEATVWHTTAETDAIYMQAQVLDPDEVRARRFASGADHALEPPQVELEPAPPPGAEPAPGTPAPETGGDDPGTTAPPPPEAQAAEEEAEDAASSTRIDSPWAQALPPVLQVDLEALRKLARTSAPPVVLRRLIARITSYLGLAQADVLEAIATSSPRWDSAAILRLDWAWPSSSVTPHVATDLVAFETLVRVSAPPLLIRRLATRIGSALALTDQEILAALEAGDYTWISAMPGISADKGA